MINKLTDNLTPMRAIIFFMVMVTISQNISAVESIDLTNIQHKKALQLAQDGDYDTAIKIITSLEKKHPSQKVFFYDRLVILVWANREQEALNNLDKLIIEDTPEYVLRQMAKLTRDFKYYDLSLEMYSQLLDRDPGDSDAFLGYMMSLADSGESTKALDMLLERYQKNKNNLSYIETIGYIYGVKKNYIQQAHHYQKYLTLKPDEKRIRREYIYSLKNIGASELALDQIKDYPDVLSEKEVYDIKLDQASHHIRWGILPFTDYKKRFDDTDKALEYYAKLDDTNVSSNSYTRKKYDHMVALHDRFKMVEVIELYESIEKQQQTIPNYVLTVVAAAYLYLEIPDKALAINQQILSVEPDNYNAMLSLFYTYIELDDFLNAYQTIDQLANDQVIWNNSPNKRVFKPNNKKIETDRISILARAYGDELAHAQKKLEAMLSKAPSSTDIRHDLALVYQWRGWNDKSIQEFQNVLNIEPLHLSSSLGKATANFNHRKYRVTEKKVEKYYQRFPENKEVQRLYKNWQTHNKRQLVSNFSLGTSDGTELGSREFTFDTYLYSRPLDYNYRAFLHFNYATADFVEGKGIEKRPGLGVEYRSKKNIYIGELNHALNNSEDVGIATSATHFIDDYLNLTMTVELNSLQAPLRGRRVGIDANRVSLGINYRWHESQQVGASISLTDFDDSNTRAALQAFVERRVISKPKYKMTLRLDTSVSVNDQDNVIYFSPKRDFSASITSDNLWRLYRHYDREFNHRLRLSGGIYEQENFGSAETWSIQYEHIWKVNRDLEFVYGISRNRRVFDGEPELGKAIYGKIDWRF